MTKDRRLGRGLAALLGTPLEEDNIVEGASGSGAQASNPPQRPSIGPKKPVIGASKTAAASEESSSSSSLKTATSRTGVTGAVPLSRPSATTSTTKAEPAVEPALAASDPRVSGATLQLSVYEIDNNPFQPRRQFNEEEIASLAESIREHKQLQPVLVRKVGDRYQLISGERRLRATIHAGLKTIRAEVREADDRLVAELAIVENLQRKDLDPIEKALSFRRYIDEHKCTQDDFAKRLKIDRSTIANLMRLLELPEKIQYWIQTNKVTAGHARALLPLGDEDQQMEFAELIQSEHWSVRETERRVAEKQAEEDGVLPKGPTGGRTPKSAQLAAVEQQLRLSLGTKTDIKQSAKGRGKIVISFASGEEFDRLMAILCPQAQQRAA